MYQIKITYKDEKALLVPVEKERLGEFYAALADRKIFWFEQDDNGFWTDFANIRYVQIFLQKPDGSLAEIPQSEKIEHIGSALEEEVQ